MNRPRFKHRKGEVRWDKVDPQTAFVLQVRFGGGRESGFYLDQSKSPTLEGMCGDPEYRPIVEAIRNQASRILKRMEEIL